MPSRKQAKIIVMLVHPTSFPLSFDICRNLVTIVALSIKMFVISNKSTLVIVAFNSVGVTARGNQGLSLALSSSISLVVGATSVVQ